MNWEQRKIRIRQQWKHKVAVGVPLLIFFAVYMCAYHILENLQIDSYYHPFVQFDLLIPFLEYFIIPYLMWFAWIPLACLYFFLKDEDTFRPVKIMLIVGMSAFIIISAIFPTILYLRPDVMPRDNFCCHLVSALYAADTPTNVFPSIHVFNTLVIFWGVFHSSGKLFRSKTVRWFTLVFSVLIILATVFLKQHSLLDVAGAFLLFGIIRLVAYILQSVAARNPAY